MPIYRAEHKKDFTIILNSILSDTRLSYGARGLMAHVLTHHDNWVFTGEDYFVTDIDKKTKVRGYIKELINFGYLKRYREQNERGILGNSVYTFFEMPNFDLPNLEKPNLENQKQVKSEENSDIQPNCDLPNLDLPNLGLPNLENLNVNNTNNINNINNNIYNTIFDFWISKNIKKHRTLTSEMKKNIDKTLKEYSKDEILEAINNYGDMYNDLNYQWFNYQWGLNEFLVRRDKDSIRQLGLFLNDGSKYLNYKSWSIKNNPSEPLDEESCQKIALEMF
ncbi:hypothetical protein [Clostridium paraputrificum]|uniref:hypothetical protein n=1 Tax=Clostridium paraputrificum TaxID=29363 RepID=UPI000C087A9A|nr:hypothetical protein [Clostridium paraputrificum]